MDNEATGPVLRVGLDAAGNPRRFAAGLSRGDGVLAGWLLQLQALYLELSDAPKVWHPTRPAETVRALGQPSVP